MGCASTKANQKIVSNMEQQQGEKTGDAVEPANNTIDNQENTEISKEIHEKYPPAESFEIQLDETDSIIRKHPPKRIQRLVETPSVPPSLEELEEKLANAELRRNEILQHKINVAKPKEINHEENINTPE